nr:MAG TPA: hypothetical protein [Crassvirales sp.]DAS01626.1 MAG TPA: hypothetical protein [Caudoviricetes sp.]
MSTHILRVFLYIHRQTVLISIQIGFDTTLTLIQISFSRLNVFHPIFWVSHTLRVLTYFRIKLSVSKVNETLYETNMLLLHTKRRAYNM